MIEVMVAVAISTVLILTAVAAFRVATGAIATATSLSIENSLLRTGWQASLEDVDFYHSLADDKPPYNKGFMRARTLRVDDPATPNISEPFIRRAFQPIMFQPSTDPDVLPFDHPDPANAAHYRADAKVLNPNTLQAHDPRSIDRSFLYFNYTPSGARYRYISPVWVHGDYRLVCATDMRSRPDEIDPKFPTGIASGGTATVLTDLDKKNIDADPNPPWDSYRPQPDSEYPEQVRNLALRTSVNQVVPMLYWQMFSRLSLLGATEYTSMGYNLFLQDQNGNPPGDNSGWMPGDWIGTSPHNFPSDGGPQCELAQSCWGVGGLWWRSDVTGSRDFTNWIGRDFRESRTWAIGLRALLADSADRGNGGGIDNQNGMSQLLETGNVAGGGNQSWYYGYAQDGNTGDVARNDRRFTSKTVRLPYNMTDGEFARIDPAGWHQAGAQRVATYVPTALDYDSKPRDYPALETTILRYYRAGGQGTLTVVTSTITDAISGKRVELVSSPYGTSYRGARQHWRLYSPGYADGNAIGDFYDPMPGPLHAP